MIAKTAENPCDQKAGCVSDADCNAAKAMAEQTSTLKPHLSERRSGNQYNEKATCPTHTTVTHVVEVQYEFVPKCLSANPPCQQAGVNITSFCSLKSFSCTAP